MKPLDSPLVGPQDVKSVFDVEALLLRSILVIISQPHRFFLRLFLLKHLALEHPVKSHTTLAAELYGSGANVGLHQSEVEEIVSIKIYLEV